MGRLPSHLIRELVTNDQIVDELYENYQNDSFFKDISKHAIKGIIEDYIKIKKKKLFDSHIVYESGLGSTKITARRIKEDLTGVDKTVKCTTELDIVFKSWLNDKLEKDSRFRELVSAGRIK